MVTLISKSKVMKVYNLDCSIPLKNGKKTDLSENKKTKSRGMKVASERNLTMLPNERRENLPDAILESASIKKAIAEKQILVKVQKKSEPKKSKSEPTFSGEQSSTSSKKGNNKKS